MKHYDRRLQTLEAKTMAAQRRSLSGLAALWEAGKLTVTEMTDAELERIIASSLPGAVDVRHLSDAELEAIITGGKG